MHGDPSSSDLSFILYNINFNNKSYYRGKETYLESKKLYN